MKTRTLSNESDHPFPFDGTYAQNQRAALQDLLELSAHCHATNQAIEEKYQTTKQRLEYKRKRLNQYLTKRQEQKQQVIDDEHTLELERFGDEIELKKKQVFLKHQSELKKYKEATSNRDDQLKQEFNQTLWLADSLLEGTEAQLQKELRKLDKEVLEKRDRITQLSQAVDQQLHRYRQPYSIESVQVSVSVDPSCDLNKELDQQFETGEQQLEKMKQLFAPGFFQSWRPYLGAVIPLTISVGVAYWVGSQSDMPFPKALMTGGAIVGGVGLLIAIIWGLLWWQAKKSITKACVPIKESLVLANQCVQAIHDHAYRQAKKVKIEAMEKRRSEIEKAKAGYVPLLEERKSQAQKILEQADCDYQHIVNQQSERSEVEHESIEQNYKKQVQSHHDKSEQLHADATDRYDRLTSKNKSEYEHDRKQLQTQWSDGSGRIQSLISDTKQLEALFDQPWDSPSWQNWTPPKSNAPLVKLGQLNIEMKKIASQVGSASQYHIDAPDSFSIPAMLSFPEHGSLYIRALRAGRKQAVAALHTAMIRLLTSLPAGRARFTLIDPVGLGQNFAGFMHLADYDEALVGPRIWSEVEHIEQRLIDLTQHMENVIQKYLRNEFDTIDRYNEQAGELAEPYRFVVIADLPSNLTEEAMQRLVSIVHSGPRCGVYTLILRNTWQELPFGFDEQDLLGNAVVLNQTETGFEWDDEIYRQFPLVIDPAPDETFLTGLLNQIGENAQHALHVELPFDSITPTENLWTKSTTTLVNVPLGRCGATRLQELSLGKGVAQHVLLSGKTGSGKSTLLHVMITNLALWYSPDEVEFYLVDFKKGVEFKAYATHHLPHAKAIAIESDREFGVSVLERLDAELIQRGELFRSVGVQDLRGYREARPDAIMPRTLLLIDEFQELFSEDDRLAQQSALLLDRLVRQGRAFGIHILLGSQTLAGTTGLPRGTMGQMAVRIALQCSEADSQLILNDDNSAAKLLSRPGEAIYNDSGGLIEGNSPFQVSWLSDQQRDHYLQRINDWATAQHRTFEPPIVFEGNAPSDIHSNHQLVAQIEAGLPTKKINEPLAWLGDPITIKAPTAVQFKKQSGSNLLIIGQQDDVSLQVITSSLLSLYSQQPVDGARFYLLDGSSDDSQSHALIEKLATLTPHTVNLISWRHVESCINELAVELQRRLDEDLRDEPNLFLFIYGLQRFRMLRRKEDDFSFSYSEEGTEAQSPKTDQQFVELLREGPALGIHTISWCDTFASVERTVNRQAMREFDYRVLFQMSADDSSNLIDSPQANRLGFYKAILYSEEHGYPEKFRPYALPDTQWLNHFADKMNAR